MTFALVLLTLFVVFQIPVFRTFSAFATLRDRAALAAGGFFIGAGLLHFLSPDRYVAMVPPMLPEPLALVFLSGVAEIACGLGLLFRRTRRPAAWATIAVLFAILPANIYVATSGGVVEGLSTARWYYFVRIPFQLFYVAWVAWSGGLLPGQGVLGVRRPGQGGRRSAPSEAPTAEATPE